jgi:hypothetical protein
MVAEGGTFQEVKWAIGPGKLTRKSRGRKSRGYSREITEMTSHQEEVE